MPADVPGEAVLAIGYIRVSMKREEMISPETQQAAIEAYATRTGRKVIDWVVDLDKTGRNFKRKIMGAIIRVKAGEAAEIVVWKFSRFGRSRHGIAVNLAELEEAGGRLISATEEVDADTATGKFTRGMLFEVAAFESDRAAETWAEAYSYRIREGLPPLGRPRFGYVRLGRVPDEEDSQRTRHVPGEEERYVPDPQARAVLSGMYRSYIAGEGFTVIARRLTADGWRTAYGNKWRPQAVKDVLDSGFGAGYLLLHDPGCRCRNETRCRNRIHVRGRQEPVISDPQWEQYAARRAGSSGMAPRLRTPQYPVSGLVRCGHCRGAMVASGFGEGGAALFSCSRQRNYGDCPGKPSLTVTRIVDAVRAALAEWAADLDAQARAEAARSRERQTARDAVSRLEDDLAKAEKSLVRLALARAADEDGAIPDESWKTAAAQSRADRDQAAEDLRAAKAKATAASADLAPVVNGILRDWDTLPSAALNQVLRHVVRRITVQRAGERRRDARGHLEPVTARVEVVPVWMPDPWEPTQV